jgi:hypothetical protein
MLMIVTVAQVPKMTLVALCMHVHALNANIRNPSWEGCMEAKLVFSESMIVKVVEAILDVMKLIIL